MKCAMTFTCCCVARRRAVAVLYKLQYVVIMHVVIQIIKSVLSLKTISAVVKKMKLLYKATKARIDNADLYTE